MFGLINIFPSKIFPTVLLPARSHQNCQVLLVAVSINGLSIASSNLQYDISFVDFDMMLRVN